MSHAQIRNACLVVLCALSIFAIQPYRTGFANPPPKKAEPSKPKVEPTKPKPEGTVTPKPGAVKPKPNVRTNRASSPGVTSVPSPTTTVMNNASFAGMAPRSRSWQSYHRHHRWVYEVRFRSYLWRTRVFASYPAAQTFMVYLRSHHFERFLLHPTEGVWAVNYWTLHSRHFGTYASLPVAQRVEFALMEHGIPAWVVWHRRYYW
jgi:hypothetical protein